MAKASTRKLKVFQAHFGFYDVVVAAPSQAAALRAWGVHQNLFATGMAKTTADPQAVEAARTHPGALLKRAVGSDEAFTLEPANLPTLPNTPPKPGRRRSNAPAPLPAAAPPPPADRRDLDAAERALRELEDRWAQRVIELRRLRDELEAAQAAEEEAYKARKTSALAALSSARQAYRHAGGGESG